MSNADFKNLCGVWLSDPSPGKTRYMSGKLTKDMVTEILSCSNESPTGEVKLYINKNNKRPDKKDPDYRISCKSVQPQQVAQPANKPIDDDLPF